MKENPKPRQRRSSASSMARSKFGAILRRNTDRVTFLLIYTLLEWVLIALLLVNGLFSYLASRFASFFGLEPPCVFCSRLDRLFDPPSADFRRLLCDAHAADMCRDCSSSRPAALLSYAGKCEAADGEQKKKRFACSCCEADLRDGVFAPPYFSPQPSWDVSGAAEGEGYRIQGVLDGDVIFEVEEGKIRNVVALDQEGEKPVIDFSDSRRSMMADDSSMMELVASQFSNVLDEERRLPLELIDSITEMRHSMSPVLSSRVGVEEDGREVEEKAVLHSERHMGNGIEEENSPVPLPKESISNHENEVAASPEEGEEEEFAGPQACEENNKSMGSEICEQEHPEPAQFREQVPEVTSTEDPVTESLDDTVDEGQAIEPELHEVVEDRAPETPTHTEVIHGLHKRFFFERRESGTEYADGSLASELDGGQPISIDQLKSALKSEHKALNALYAELEEERSASAVAACETMTMINRLQEEKAAMKMEALQYQRMMEEQSEYDQEALQLLNELLVKREKEKKELEKELEVYRERVLIYETKELKRTERQKKNGKDGLSPSSSSSSSSSAEESDGLLFDYCERGDMACSLDQSIGTTTDVEVETAKHLVDESLADFEEERVSILEQLKTLEERLFTLENDDSDYVKMMENMPEGNHHELNGEYRSLVDVSDGTVNGFSDIADDNIGKLHYEGKNASCRGKRLLPLFDAAAFETEDGVSLKQDAVLESASPKAVSELAKEQEKLLIAEEIDDLYDRLQALEADREFLKHCIKSLKKGDRGLNLLEEILQHLRDLRSVELRVRKAGDDAVALQTV